MNRAELVEHRLAAQRISSTTFTRPAEVVAWLGAVQAQDYLGALWAVGLRLAEAREGDVERALADRTIVRSWPMRGTLHFVAAADARWILELLAPRMIGRAAKRLRDLEIEAATLARARRILGKRLAGGPVTRAEVYAALDAGGVSTEGQRGIHMLWCLAHECFLCFGPREGKQQTFALFDEWLPAARSMPREEAFAELATRYFTGHGPASLADFAWWSGLNRGEAQRAVALAGSRLEETSFGGRTHWLRTQPLPAKARAAGYLLPAFDEFVVAYADRTAVLAPAFASRLNGGGGLLNPIAVVDGRVVATWKRTLARGAVTIAPAPFAPLPAAKTRAIEHAFRRYAAFLGLDASPRETARRRPATADVRTARAAASRPRKRGR
jgi:Winged helix DNA-binding domain